eukprot:g6044.t1
METPTKSKKRFLPAGRRIFLLQAATSVKKKREGKGEHVKSKKGAEAKEIELTTKQQKDVPNFVVHDNDEVSKTLKPTSPIFPPNASRNDKWVIANSRRSLPVTELFRVLHEVETDKFWNHTSLLVIVLIVFYWVLSSTTELNNAYPQNTAIQMLVNPGDVFDSPVTHPDDFWKWVEGTLVPVLYDDTWYEPTRAETKYAGSGAHKRWSDRGYVARYLRLVGGVRMRQVAVSRDSCKTRRFTYLSQIHSVWEDAKGMVSRARGKMDTLDGSCFDDLIAGIWPITSVRVDEQQKKRIDLVTGNEVTGMNYTENLSTYSTLGRVVDVDLGEAGYLAHLPAITFVKDNMYPGSVKSQGEANVSAKLKAFEVVKNLMQKQWIDASTRAVAVDFSLYNTNTRLLSAVRVSWTFDLSGLTDTGLFIKSGRASMYSEEYYQDWFRLGAEIFCMFYSFSLAVFKLKELCRTNSIYNYFWKNKSAGLKNLLEFAYLITFAFGLWRHFAFMFSSQRWNFDVNNEMFIDYTDELRHAQEGATWFGLAYLFLVLKLTYLPAYYWQSKSMLELWNTLIRGSTDLVVYSIFLITVTFGFGAWASFAFGGRMFEYRSVSSATLTLVGVLFRDFDYESLRQASPEWGDVFFMFYMTVVGLVMMNVFIAILTKFYDISQADILFDKMEGLTLSGLAYFKLKFEKWLVGHGLFGFLGPCLRKSCCHTAYSKHRKSELGENSKTSEKKFRDLKLKEMVKNFQVRSKLKAITREVARRYKHRCDGRMLTMTLELFDKDKNFVLMESELGKLLHSKSDAALLLDAYNRVMHARVRGLDTHLRNMLATHLSSVENVEKLPFASDVGQVLSFQVVLNGTKGIIYINLDANTVVFVQRTKEQERARVEAMKNESFTERIFKPFKKKAKSSTTTKSLTQTTESPTQTTSTLLPSEKRKKLFSPKRGGDFSAESFRVIRNRQDTFNIDDAVRRYEDQEKKNSIMKATEGDVESGLLHLSNVKDIPNTISEIDVDVLARETRLLTSLLQLHVNNVNPTRCALFFGDEGMNFTEKCVMRQAKGSKYWDIMFLRNGRSHTAEESRDYFVRIITKYSHLLESGIWDDNTDMHLHDYEKIGLVELHEEKNFARFQRRRQSELEREGLASSTMNLNKFQRGRRESILSESS